MSSQTGLYEGDRIRIEGSFGITRDCTVERFRDCLGVFLEPEYRTMGHFTPLCELYGFGTGSENAYMPNCGEYIKNPVPLWMQIPRTSSEGTL
jgi:hypothetical protein